jgi:6-phosphogluconolactonase (cycloisomerase 2 family)
MVGALPIAPSANDLSSRGEVIMSCATRRPNTRKHLRHGFLIFLLSAACSSGGDGGGGTTTNNNPPAGGANQFAYVINFAANNVQAFTSDGSGNFTMVGQPITTGVNPHNVNVDKAGRFVYISNVGSNFVSGFKINSIDGSLTPINPAPGSPVTDASDPTNNSPYWSVFDTTGQFLYVIAGATTPILKSYSIDSTSGALTQIGTTGPLDQCATGHSVTVSPNNKFVYVGCRFNGVVYSFSRNTQTGALTNLGATNVIQNGAPGVSFSVVVDPTSSLLFVGVTDGVTMFNIDPNSGNISGQKLFVAGNTPHSVALDGNGHLYTANLNDSTVSAFSISGGTLTQLAGSPFATGGEPNQVVVHPDGTVLFTADQTTNTVTRFILNADGTLTRNGIAATLPANSGTNNLGLTNK